MQTGPGQLYSWSSQSHQRGGRPLVLRCNHTIVYEGPGGGREERLGPLLQLLKVSSMTGTYSRFTLGLDFHITASLLIPGLDGGRELVGAREVPCWTECLLTEHGGFVPVDGDGETCPKGFVLDTASYCAGMGPTLLLLMYIDRVCI